MSETSKRKERKNKEVPLAPSSKLTPITPAKKQKVLQKKRRTIRQAKYKRFLAFVQANGLDLTNIQKFEVFDLQDDNGEDKMPFGKYSGENIIDLWRNLIEGGRSYLIWLYKQDIRHEDLRQKLEDLRRKEIDRTGTDPIKYVHT